MSPKSCRQARASPQPVIPAPSPSFRAQPRNLKSNSPNYSETGYAPHIPRSPFDFPQDERVPCHPSVPPSRALGRTGQPSTTNGLVPTDTWPLRHCHAPPYPVSRQYNPLPKPNRPLRPQAYSCPARLQPRPSRQNGREWEEMGGYLNFSRPRPFPLREPLRPGSGRAQDERGPAPQSPRHSLGRRDCAHSRTPTVIPAEAGIS